LSLSGRFRLAACALLLTPALAAAQARTPFGAPGEGAAAPPGNALVAWLLAQQSAFYKQMQAIVSEAANGGSLWMLYALALAYGVFHAAGPGHGKAVISAYIVANERAAMKGVAIAFGAAAVQAFVAIAAVLFIILFLGLAGRARSEAFALVEIAGYLLIALLGLMLLIRKARSFMRLLRPAPASLGSAAVAPHADCDHIHLPGPEFTARADWRGMAGAMLAAGIRPCTGAIIMLTFCIANALYWQGVATVLIMALGTALCTSAIALMAVGVKGLALRFAAARKTRTEIIGRIIEIIGAALVMLLGLLLAVGFATSGPIAG
jgi:nickel/cobalt transporter (NicO) family protein